MDAVARPTNVLLVGGTSAIGLAIVAELAGPASRVVLAGRDRDRTLAVGAHLGNRREFAPFDATDPATHEASVAQAWAGGEIDLVVVAHGVLPDNDMAWTDPAVARAVMDVNLTSAAAVLAAVAARMRDQGHGTIVVLSSVAGQRPRPANFIYGATKAGLDALATGLGDVLAPHGCRVVVVRPGFVHSPMTVGRSPAPFATTPEAVGEAVARGLRRGRDVIWAPAIMRLVAAVFRFLPRAVVRRIPD